MTEPREGTAFPAIVSVPWTVTPLAKFLIAVPVGGLPLTTRFLY